MKRHRWQGDDEISQENELCKRVKEDPSETCDGVTLLLDQSFRSSTLVKLYQQKQRKELCIQTLAWIFSRCLFDHAVLEKVNFLDRFSSDLGEENKTPKEIVLQLLQYKNLTASEVKKLTLRFRNDWKVMLAAIANYHFAVTFAAKKLQNNREFVKRSLMVNDKCLHWFPKKFHLDQEIALESMNNLESYRLIKPLFNDKSFLLKAVKKNGLILRHVPEELMDDNVISEALKQNSQAISFVPLSKRKNYKKDDGEDSIDEFLRSPSKKNYSFLDSPYSPSDFILSQETTFEAIVDYVRKDGLNLRLLNSDYSFDRNIVMECIKSNGYALKFAASSFRNDKETVLFALDQPHKKLFKVVEKIDYIGEDLIDDREVVLQLVIRAAKRKFEVDWMKFNAEMILFDQEFIMDVYKALF